MAGNLYETEVETPRNDASYGLYLPGDGKGNFEAKMPYESGLMLKGEVRKIKEIHSTANKKAILLARNDNRLAIVTLH